MLENEVVHVPVRKRRTVGRGADNGPDGCCSHAHDEARSRRLQPLELCQRGRLDGQWQLVRTWDIAKKRYCNEVTPEAVAHYGYGIISRFLSKYSGRLPQGACLRSLTGADDRSCR
jgi:hypothetical protein